MWILLHTQHKHSTEERRIIKKIVKKENIDKNASQ